MPENPEVHAEINNRVEEQFGWAAADYTHSRVHSDPAALAKIVALAQVHPGDVGLDVATGAGHVAIALARWISSVTAYDLTAEMLRETARNAEARGLSNITTRRGQAEHLPFADASFDIVAVRQAPHHFADVRSAVREMARVAKTGARIVIADSYSPEDPVLDRQWNHIEKLRDPSHVRNYTHREWREIVCAAGLRITFEELDCCTDNGRCMNFAEWTHRMKTPPSAVAELRRLFDTASEELRELLRMERSGGEIGFCVPEITIVALR